MYERKPIRLLVTGFGPYHATMNNPSTVVGKLLDGETLSTKPHGLHRAPQQSDDDTRPVRLHFVSIPVDYKAIQRYISEWYESDQWDAIIHVGYAPAYTAVGIETWARRIGYSTTELDVFGKTPPDVSGGIGIEGDVDRWETTVDCEELLRSVKAVGFEHTLIGKDPGDFNCAFTYALSLKWAQQMSAKSEQSAIPILLVLIPTPANDGDQAGPYTVEELAQHLRIVSWIVGQQAAREQGHVRS